MDWLRYANQGAVRNQPLSPGLISDLAFLGDMGITMEVFSGGQPKKGTSTHRVGSTRHDLGNAADVFFYKDGRKLDWANKADIPIFQSIVTQAKANGVTGFGAGPGYMQPGSMHIGYGAPAVWGDDGKGVNAPGWLREAYGAGPVVSGGGGSAILAGGTGGKDTMTPFKPQPAERGLLFDKLGPKAQKFFTQDRVARMQMALEGMTLNPNQGVIAAAKQTLQSSADSRQRNATAEWLASRGRDDLANAVGSGAIDGRTAVQLAMGGGKDGIQTKVIGDRLVNAVTGEVIADFTTQGQDAVRGVVIDGKLVNPITGEVIGDYKAPEAAPTTDDIREYQFSVQNDGYTGTLAEFIDERRKAGAATTTVKVDNRAADKFAEMFASGDAKTISEVQTAGLAARRNLTRIDRLEGLLASSPTGFVGNVKRIAGEFGINSEGLSDIQSAMALINALVPEQRPPGSGPMSDADLELFKQSLPRIINTPAGNAEIIRTMRAVAQYDAEGAAIVQKLRANELNRAQAFAALQNRADPLASFRTNLGSFGPAPAPATPLGTDGLTADELRYLGID